MAVPHFRSREELLLPLHAIHRRSSCRPEVSPFSTVFGNLRLLRAKNLFSCPCVLRKTTPLFSILKDVAIGISFLSSVSSVVYLVLWEVRMRRRQRRQGAKFDASDASHKHIHVSQLYIQTDVRTTKDHLIEQVPRLQLDEENVDEPLNEGGVADDTDQLVSTESE